MATIGAFRLFLSQLERLHSIALAEARRVQEINAFSAAAISIPLAVVMIMLGAVTFRYVTAQAALAYKQLQQAEGELRLLNAELEDRVETRTAELRAVQEELVRKERLAALGQLTATVSRAGPRESDSCVRWDPPCLRRISRNGEATGFFGGLQGEGCA